MKLKKSVKINFGKCPYWKGCKLYSKKSKVCTEEGGFYGSKYPGCYREMGKKVVRK